MTVKFTLDETTHEVSISRRHPHLALRIDGHDHEMTEVPGAGDGRHSMTIGGTDVHFARVTLGARIFVRFAGRTFEVENVDPFSGGSATGAGQDALRAPMPGAIITVHRQAGESVTRGETLVTIESMKLQTALPAPRDGVIATVLRTEGETFEKDEIIVMLEPEIEKA